MAIKKHSILVALMVSVAASGWITNATKLPMVATAIVDGILLCVYGAAFLVGRARRTVLAKEYSFQISAFFLFLFGLFLVAIWGQNSLVERVLGFRNYGFYAGLWIPILAVGLSEQRIVRVSSIVGYILVFVSGFGIFQALFSSYLPDWLLRVDGEAIFGFYEKDISRPTGLVGNTIIFGGAAVATFVFWYCRALSRSSHAAWVFVAVSLLAIVLSWSRLAMAGTVFAIVMIHLLYHRISLALFKIFGFGLVVAVCGFTYLQYSGAGNFFLERMTSKEVTTASSDEVHFREIRSAADQFAQNPFLGVGLGSQGQSGTSVNKIITDGYIWQTLLELGLIVAFLYLVFVFSVLIYLVRNRHHVRRERLYLIVTPIVLLVYFHAAGVLNSSFAGRINLLSTWLFSGLAMAYVRIWRLEKKG